MSKHNSHAYGRFLASGIPNAVIPEVEPGGAYRKVRKSREERIACRQSAYQAPVSLSELKGKGVIAHSERRNSPVKSSKGIGPVNLDSLQVSVVVPVSEKEKVESSLREQNPVESSNVVLPEYSVSTWQAFALCHGFRLDIRNINPDVQDACALLFRLIQGRKETGNGVLDTAIRIASLSSVFHVGTDDRARDQECLKQASVILGLQVDFVVNRNARMISFRVF